MIELYDSSSSDSKDYYFISKPEESLNKIAKFLEFRVEQRMIDFIYNSYINEKYESSVNEFTYMKSISTILDSWKEQLSSKSKLLIKNILREELLFYGYDE